MAPIKPPTTKKPGGSGTSGSNYGGYGGFGGGAAAGFLGATFLPNIVGGLFGGGGSGSAGGVSEVISLLPLMLIGGGALYAYQTLKK